MRKISAVLLMLCMLCITSCKSIQEQPYSQSSQPHQNASEITEQSQTEFVASAVAPQDLKSGKTIIVSGALKTDKHANSIAKLQSVLNGYKYNISLSVHSIDGSKSLQYNTQAQIFGACTVKAAYTLYACKQMENGNANLQTELIYQQKHYEPGTGDMQYSPFGTVFTMETALCKSMSISDNVGYLMSVDYFGRDGYNTWISDLGCDSLIIKPTVWSLKTRANDLVKVWCEIYNYFKSDTKYSKFLYNCCTNTAGNYATAALNGVEYSHKQGHNSTGDWLSLSDAGIVWKGDNPYIIAILTDAPGPSSYSAGEFAKIIDIVHNDLF